MIEQVLQTGTEQVNYEDVVKSFLSEVVDIGNTGCNKSAIVRDFFPDKYVRHPTRIL